MPPKQLPLYITNNQLNRCYLFGEAFIEDFFRGNLSGGAVVRATFFLPSARSCSGSSSSLLLKHCQMQRTQFATNSVSLVSIHSAPFGKKHGTDKQTDKNQKEKKKNSHRYKLLAQDLFQTYARKR